MQGDSEDRTEAATPRRLQKARDEGQVALSREVTPAAILAATALVLAVAAPSGVRDLARALAVTLEHLDTADPLAATRAALVAGGRAVLPFAVACAVAAGLATLGQTGLVLNWRGIKPGFSRLDLRRNLGRVAGPGALLEAGKSLAKLGLAGLVMVPMLGGPWRDFAVSLLAEPAALPGAAARLLLRVLLAGLMVQGVIAAADVARARWSHARSLRMSRHEVREEQRESDGDPHTKARIRRIRMTRARRRMMAAVPTATVVITNPTHYAVALVYQRGAGGAPRVVAKGVDAMAARIREVAERARVPLVRDPPLARALWRVELDTEIPAALFQAVAEIIAYVWRLRTPARAR